MPDAAVTLPPDLLAGLDELAASTGRQRAELAREAVAKYLDYERWAAEHIREGLRQARVGEFASEEEMAAIFGDDPAAAEAPR
jgi:RHH-type transcriptional regulator, rel operon repressor / antitoxin RelB